MPKNEKLDCTSDNNDQKDIQWFENYEKRSKINRLESLRNKDILNYIKDIERNCRLEVNSGDEDYAGTKRSSNCSVRCSDTEFRSFKKVKSRVTSKRNKNVTSLEKKIKSSDRNNMDARNYCCSSGKSRFYSNPDLTVQENSRKDLNTSVKSTYRYPKSSNKRGSYKYCESSPRFYGSYSRRHNKTWPAVTEMTSREVIKDWSQDAIPDSRINRSRITNRKTAKVRTFKSLRGRKFGDMSIYPSIAPNETMRKRDPYYRIRKQKEDTRRKELSEESDINDFDSQKPLNKFYPGRNTTDKLTVLSHQNLSRNEEYKGRYNNEYSYCVRKPRPQTFWSSSLRSNRLTATARLPETSTPLQKRTSRWGNEVGPPLKASSSIIGASIDRNYRQARESKYKNNTNQRRRKSDILGERGSSCCCKPGLLKAPRKLCEVVRTRESKQWLGCCCEDVEQDETTDCSRYCRCPENVNNPIRRNYRSPYDSTRRPVGVRKRINYTEEGAALRETQSKSVQSRNNNGGESEFYSTIRENLQSESATYTAFDRFDVLDDLATNNGDRIELENLKPHVSFPDDRPRRTRRDLIAVAREYKKLSSGLKSNRGEALEAPRALRKRITRGYPTGEEFPFEIRTPRKLASGDSSRLRYEAAESACECTEPFHDPPAACLIGSCTCVGIDEDVEKNDSDSSREVSTACCCCCSSSSSSHDEDPVKKLESFCERVKAVNQDVFRKPSRSNARRYFYGNSDEREQSEASVQTAAQAAGSIARGWLTDPARLRLEKPKRSRGATSLEKILIYPPRGEGGPPLTLYKRSSNINCRVKGDTNTGFRYSVTYVQKFVSPTWMPNLSPQVPMRETDEECGCSADYG